MSLEKASSPNPQKVRALGLTRGLQFLYQQAVVLVIVIVILGTIGILWHLYRQSANLYEAMATHGAGLQARTIEEMRKTYTTKVVDHLRQQGINPDKIPLPITLTREVGLAVKKERPGAEIRLFSDYPFPNTPAHGRVLDTFQKEALQKLRDNPQKPVFQFEIIAGRPSLRYAIADRMQAKCLTCHNDPATGSPKTDWQENDVRGVLEIIRPLDNAVAVAHTRLQWTIAGTVVGYGLVLVSLGLVVGKLRRTARVLRDTETRTRAIVDNAVEGIVSINDRGLIQSFNPAAAKIFGYQEAEVVGKNVSLLMPEPHRHEYDQYLERYRTTGETKIIGIGLHVPGRRKDGTIIHLEISVSAVPLAEGRFFTGIVRDLSERLRTEEALDQERYLLHTLMESLPDSIYFKDASSRFLRINQALGQRFGLNDPAVAIGKADVDFFTPEHAQQTFKNEQDMINTGVPVVGMEEKETWPDGHTTWASTTKMPLRDKDGKINGTFGISRDITQRKQVEEALREVTDRLNLALKSSQVGTWTWDIARNTVTWDDYIHPLFGLKPGTFGGTYEAFRACLHGDDRDRVEKEVLRSVQEGAEYDNEFRVVWPDGSVHVVAARGEVHRNEEGLPARMAGVCWDISRRKHAEDALAERAVLSAFAADIGNALTKGTSLSQILHQCAEVMVHYLGAAFARIWTLNDQGTVLELQASAGLYTHLDGPHGRVPVGQFKIGMIALDRKPHLTNEVIGDPKVNQEWAQKEGMVAFAGHPLLVQDRLVGVMALFSRQHLSEATLEVLASVADGIALGISRWRGAEELKKAKEAAEAASRAKSDFLANVSHEIRTPMNAILGMTELALDSDLQPEQREYLEIVKSSADSLLSVINDILDFSKIEAGKLELEHINFSLRDSLGETLKILGQRAHKKDLELACSIARAVPDALVGDPLRLRQIVVNLVGNALKFTEKGEVVLSVVPVEESMGRGSSERSAFLHFSVRDTGIGIPASKQEMIFREFEQVDSSTTRRFGGTGLGLAISSRLVKLMGGRIWVESEEGKGSTFHFTARFDLQAEGAGKEDLLPVDLQDLPVLVVDDNATNRRILEEILRNWHMQPTVVDNGEAALALLEKEHQAGRPFVLVLLDSHMPGMDGFELAQRMRQKPELAGATIMMLTSGGHPGDIDRCRALGIADYLMKPITQSELFDRVVTNLSLVQGIKQDRPGAGQSTDQTPASRSLRVLLAEDIAVNQMLAVRLLEKRGHQVVVTGNGKEALVALGLKEREGEFSVGSSSSQGAVMNCPVPPAPAYWPCSSPFTTYFDVILMDVQMPDMGGFEATAIIRTLEKSAGGHIPIIAMTAHAMKGDRERCLEAGMDGYVSKPIQAEGFFKVLESLASFPHLAEVRPAPAPVSPLGTLVDWNEALQRVAGDRELLRDLVQLLLDELPGWLKDLGQAVSDGNAKEVRRLGHTIKGAMAQMGAHQAQEVAYHLETMGKENHLGVAMAVLQTMEIEYDKIRQVLVEFLNNGESGE